MFLTNAVIVNVDNLKVTINANKDVRLVDEDVEVLCLKFFHASLYI